MPQPPSPQLAPGTVFGGYQIVRTRGSGTFGCVYEALRLPLQRRVALKLLDPRLSQHPEALARFEREAATTAAFEHPNIVSVFDAGVVDGQHYLAMECLDGETLAEHLARVDPLSVVAAADLLVPLASAIGAVHDRGCIHRDLKPGNIFLARRSGGVEPVLLDFGIVKSAPGVGDPRLTRKGALLGSPAYMSPEQASSQPVDPRSDQFSLGAILWECLTGRRLFTGTTVWQILAAVQKAEVPPIREARPDLPVEIADAVTWMLARDPSERYASVRELGVALLPFASIAVRTRWSREFSAPGRPDAQATTEIRVGRDVAAFPKPLPVVTFDGVVEEASLPTEAATLPTPGMPSDEAATLSPVAPTRSPVQRVPDLTIGAATVPLPSSAPLARNVWIAAILASLLAVSALIATALHR